MSGSYFDAMGISLLRGRIFNSADVEGRPIAAVLNDAAVKRYFPGRDPVGMRIRFTTQGKLWMQVVGVVREAKGSLASVGEPQVYTHYLQMQSQYMHVIVRTPTDPAATVANIKKAVSALDKDLPLAEIHTMTDLISTSLAPQRFNAALVVLFGCLASILALTGIYGVISYSVRQRTGEIGIRMAMGAQTGDVKRMVLTQAAWMAGAGVAFGIAIAYFLTRLAAKLLFGVEPTDSTTFAEMSAALAVFALAASWISARRAAKVDPMTALRYE